MNVFGNRAPVAHVAYTQRDAHSIRLGTLSEDGRWLRLDDGGCGPGPGWLIPWMRGFSPLFRPKQRAEWGCVPGGPDVDSALCAVARSYLSGGDPVRDARKQAKRLGASFEWALFADESALVAVGATCTRCCGLPPTGFACLTCGANS